MTLSDAGGTVSKADDASTDLLNNVAGIVEGLGIEGTAGNDVFNGGLSTFTQFVGGAGDDTFNGVGGVRLRFSNDGGSGVAVTISGYDSDGATGSATDGFGDSDTFGGVGSFRGARFDDTFNGGVHNDVFILDEGDDVANGGDGDDLVRFDRPGAERAVVDLDLGTAVVTWQGGVFTDALNSIEAIRGTRQGDDEIRGSGANETFDGRGGDDTLDGRGGDDELRGNDGADVFVIGRDAGNDVVLDFVLGEDRLDLTAFTYAEVVAAFDAAGAGDTLNLAGGGSVRLDNINLEDLEQDDAILSGFPTEGDDDIDGSETPDDVQLLGGDDTFDGRGGDDTINGGVGDDTLTGGAGNDNLRGGLDRDVFVIGRDLGTDVIEDFTFGEDRLDLTAFSEEEIDEAFGDDAGLEGQDTVEIIDGVFLRMNGVDLADLDYDDALLSLVPAEVDPDPAPAPAPAPTEPAGNDREFGGGDDVFEGSSADDTVDGGGGRDEIDGGGGKDEINGGGGSDSIKGGGGSDDIKGGGGADDITGGGGKDKVDGGAGNDRVEGGRGNDVLTGGKGRDTFVFSRKDGKKDVVTDWNRKQDTVEIDGGATNFKQLKFVDRGDDVLVKYGRDAILFEDAARDDFRANDFDFV